MKILLLFFLFSCSLLLRQLSEALPEEKLELAETPPRGWNSYDSFSWTISEKEFLQNAELVAQKLLPHGYQYVVLDFLWYRKRVEGANVRSPGFDLIDEWGRLVPDPDRWPSSKGGKGLTEVANKVHAMGLKFGIHVMRGISSQAFNANTPILDTTKGGAYEEGGRKWTAKDIGIKEKDCAWMRNCFMSVDTSLGAGRAFLRSLYLQYADWGVDLVKNDCVFGDDFDPNEIRVVSEILKEYKRPILYSLSPGANATASMAKKVSEFVNMYRVTADDWDRWPDVESHFNVARRFAVANLIGAKGLRGKSWPDLDMLPLGWLTDPESNQGPHRKTNLTLDEQRTQMTLWSMAKSPLMYGGDMRNLDETTYNIIANPVLLEINSYSSNNMEFPNITGTKESRSSIDVLTKQPTSQEHLLTLTNCTDQQAKGWVSFVNDNKTAQICWEHDRKGESKPQFCLDGRKPLVELDEESSNKLKYERNLQLLAKETNDTCLNAYPDRKTRAGDRKIAFTPCGLNEDQMWELNQDGTLVNKNYGICAKVTEKATKAGGIRSWIATGRRGEVYLSLFNLDSGKTVISTNVSNLAKALPNTSLTKSPCNYTEIWSGKAYGEAKDTISAAIETYGCALFVLSCQ